LHTLLRKLFIHATSFISKSAPVFKFFSSSRHNGSDQKVTTGVFYYKWTPFLALFRRPNFRAHFVCTRPNPATRIIVTTPTERTRRSREPALQQIQIKPWSLSTFCVRPAPPFSSMFTAQQVVALCFFSLAWRARWIIRVTGFERVQKTRAKKTEKGCPFIIGITGSLFRSKNT